MPQEIHIRVATFYLVKSILSRLANIYFARSNCINPLLVSCVCNYMLASYELDRLLSLVGKDDAAGNFINQTFADLPLIDIELVIGALVAPNLYCSHETTMEFARTIASYFQQLFFHSAPLSSFDELGNHPRSKFDLTKLATTSPAQSLPQLSAPSLLQWLFQHTRDVSLAIVTNRRHISEHSRLVTADVIWRYSTKFK